MREPSDMTESENIFLESEQRKTQPGSGPELTEERNLGKE